MFIWFLRFIRGWVELKAEGKFPERFLNITTRYGLNVWDALPYDGGISASMLLSDYRKIGKVARKARVRTRVKKRHGVPFIVQKYKIRSGLAVGFVLGIALLIVLSGFIWSIRITGTKNISDTKMLEILSDNGLEIGTFSGSVDALKLRRDTQLDLDEVGWLSVNITGSIANVELKEKVEKPEISKPDKPCNIKARSDGVVTKINCQKGMTVVKNGSGVTKGDLLVSGAVDTKLETTQYLHARAEVFADVNSLKEITVPKSLNYYSVTENKSDRKRLKFFCTELPFSLSFTSYQDSISSVVNDSLCFNGVTLPVGFKTETSYELKSEKAVLDEKAADTVFKNQLLLYEAFEKGESTVKERKMVIKSDGDKYICSANYVFNENIAESVEFSVTD